MSAMPDMPCDEGSSPHGRRMYHRGCEGPPQPPTPGLGHSGPRSRIEEGRECRRARTTAQTEMARKRKQQDHREDTTDDDRRYPDGPTEPPNKPEGTKGEWSARSLTKRVKTIARRHSQHQ
ncbi:hypothetical protein OG21DRAFT_1508415 [Imleria badia]|nr:hypothetical protein OG21DRAFT_1508415 [Imleria badia]